MIDQSTPQAGLPIDLPLDSFAVVELFGHTRHVGRISQCEMAGVKMLRIDVPRDGDFEKGVTTHFYGGAAIFAIHPCDKAKAEAENRPWAPDRQPVGLLEHEDAGPDTEENHDDE